MRKISLVILSAIFAFALILPYSNQAEAAKSFKDVSNTHWAKNEINYLVNLGVISGYSNGKFGVNDKVTNAQAALMIARVLKLDTSDRPDPNLSDVSPEHPHFKEIAAVIDEGIFPKGTKFSPNAPMSREAMARTVAIAFKLKADKTYDFWDVPKDYWAYSYINKLASNNITVGYKDGSFKPKGTLTRAQFATFMARALNDLFKIYSYTSERTGNHTGAILTIKNWNDKYFDFEIEDYYELPLEGKGWTDHYSHILKGKASIVGDTAKYSRNGCTVTFKKETKYIPLLGYPSNGFTVHRNKSCFSKDFADYGGTEFFFGY